MVELGRRCESGSQAIRSRATLFGHLVAKELVTVELCEAILMWIPFQTRNFCSDFEFGAKESLLHS